MNQIMFYTNILDHEDVGGHHCYIYHQVYYNTNRFHISLWVSLLRRLLYMFDSSHWSFLLVLIWSLCSMFFSVTTLSCSSRSC